MSKPKVSIIITLFNLGEYIDESVNSALEQDYENFDVYLINDGSTEELSNERFKYFQSLNLTNLHLIEHENWWVIKSRNHAASQSDAEYLIFLDGDDKLDKEFIKKTVKVFETNRDPKLGFVTTDYQHFENSTAYIDIPEPDIAKMLVQNSAHTASLISRKAFDDVGGYDPEMKGYMDWNLWLTLIEKGYTWRVVKEPLLLYRVRKDSMVTKSIQKFNEIFRTILTKHKKLYAEHFEDVIYALQVNYMDTFKELNEKNAHIDKSFKEYSELETKYNQILEQLNNIKSLPAYKVASTLKHLVNKK